MLQPATSQILLSWQTASQRGSKCKVIVPGHNFYVEILEENVDGDSKILASIHKVSSLTSGLPHDSTLGNGTGAGRVQTNKQLQSCHSGGTISKRFSVHLLGIHRLTPHREC